MALKYVIGLLLPKGEYKETIARLNTMQRATQTAKWGDLPHMGFKNSSKSGKTV